MTHPVFSVYVDGAANKPSKGSIRTLHASRAPLVLLSASEIQSMTLSSTVSVVLAGRLYYYDGADASSVHDGLNVLVDAVGRRYKLREALQVFSGIWRITDKDLAAPPGSPTEGSAYIVAAGASGAWAGQSGKIAIRAAGTWAFSTPLAGAQAWVIDEATYYHYNGTAWASGLPGQTAAASIKLSHMHSGQIMLAVEGTSNNPGGSPANGTAYIVGASPTGNFSGFAPKAVAIRESGAWVAYTPAAGWRVDDKSTGNQLRYSGSAWLDGSGAGKLLAYWLIPTVTGSIGGGGSFVEIASQAIAALNSGNNIMFEIHGQFSIDTTIRLRRDAEGTALASRSLTTAGTGLSGQLFHLHTTSDTVSHTFRIEIQASSSDAYAVTAAIREVSP